MLYNARAMRRLILLFTLIFLAALPLVPGLRGGAGWRWPLALPAHALPVVMLAFLLAVYLVGAFALRGGSLLPVLMWSMLMTAVIGVGVVGIRGDAGFLLFTRTVSPVQTGASAAAVRYMADDLHSTLARWPQIMRDAGDANLIHFTTSPPGQALVHQVAADLFDSVPVLSNPISMALRPYQCSDLAVMRYTAGELTSTILGMLMPVWASLAVLPLYAAGRMLAGARAARHLVQWWPLVPAVLLFLPAWNSFYPALCAASFALLLLGQRQNGWRAGVWLVLAGVVMSLTTFLNFAVLPALLLFGLYTLGVAMISRRGLLWAVRMGIWYGVGLASVWAVFWLATGLTALDILRVTFDAHTDLVQRDYLPWLLLHPYDVLLFMGWPLAALFLWSTVRIRRPVDNLDVLTLSMFITFIAVDLAGIVQGENGRILSFYAPFLLLSSARLLMDALWDRPLMVAQAVTVLVMAALLPVVPLDLNPQPTGPRSDFATLAGVPFMPVQTAFDGAGAFTLESYRTVADVDQQTITLETRWRGEERTARPYAFEVVAYVSDYQNELDAATISTPHRWYAQSGAYLPTCWRSGEIVNDLTLIQVPVVAAPVEWTLELRAVDERSGAVMPGVAQLGPIQYP
ncbi:MAG: hypothetical protein OHK0046_15280 [Anaerolineae bacterium]